MQVIILQRQFKENVVKDPEIQKAADQAEKQEKNEGENFVHFRWNQQMLF